MAADPDAALLAFVDALASVLGLDALDAEAADLHPTGSRARARHEIAIERRQGLRDELRRAIAGMEARTREGSMAQATALFEPSPRRTRNEEGHIS